MLAPHNVVAFVPITDAARSRSFYSGLLGLAVESEDDFAIVLKTKDASIRLTKVPAFEPRPFTILGWEVTEIEPIVLTLQKDGIVFEKYPWMPPSDLPIWTAPGGARIAWFKDPDGNVLSLSQHPSG